MIAIKWNTFPKLSISKGILNIVTLRSTPFEILCLGTMSNNLNV